MEHFVFFLINLVVLAIILFIDRKKFKDYLWIIGLGLIFAYIFESLTTLAGFWYYHSLPLIPLVSLYTWLLYATYLSLVYFIANIICRVKNGQ